MAWVDARARIKVVLEGVSISITNVDDGETFAQSLARVYEFTQDEPLQDFPCCVMRGATLRGESYPDTLRSLYEETVDLVVVDEELGRAIELLEAYREAILTAFTADMTLNGNAAVIGLPAFEAPQAMDVGVQGARAVGSRFALPVHLLTGVTYGP